MSKKSSWSKVSGPLIKKYGGRPHPLEYRNNYQLLVMVLLSARDSDKNINAQAKKFFAEFPNMESLANATQAALFKALISVRAGKNKANWLMEIARKIKTDKNIPLDMESLTALPGIGRKSANVIMREAGVKAEGVIVDLHVLRVAPRIGLAKGTDPKKIEEQLMRVFPEKDWGEIGMALSFLGREICRPSHPEHGDCPVRKECEYFKNTGIRSAKTPVKKTKSQRNN